MSKIARARRFVRFGGLAAAFSIVLAACELSTAPRMPEEEPDDDPEEQDG